MDQKLFEELHNIAEEFGDIAQKVNESSKLRKKHSMESIKYINLCLEIGKKLSTEINTVSDANIRLRDQDNIVLNTSLILKSNIDTQKDLINEIKKNDPLDSETEKLLLDKIDNLDTAITDVLKNIEIIIEQDNIIILLDKLLLARKQLQQESINNLIELAEISLEDADKAIAGSSSNLERGLDMVEKYKTVKQLIDDGKITELNELVKEANSGWNIAVNVNNSSKAQLEFAEKVKQFTHDLHDDSIAIRDLIIKKHNIFEQNLQTVTVLTVLLSLNFAKYLDMGNVLKDIDYNQNVREQINNLNAYIKIACRDIKIVSALNYDMTDSIHLNNEIETKAVAMNKEEIEYYDKIKNEVVAMTEATKYPIEGSGRNIINGKKLEETLQKIIMEIN